MALQALHIFLERRCICHTSIKLIIEAYSKLRAQKSLFISVFNFVRPPISNTDKVPPRMLPVRRFVDIGWACKSKLAYAILVEQMASASPHLRWGKIVFKFFTDPVKYISV